MPLRCVSPAARPASFSSKTFLPLRPQRRIYIRTASFDTPYARSLINTRLLTEAILNTRSLDIPIGMAGSMQTQVRSHSGHHHHDNTYLLSKNKKDAGVRITRIGLFSNLGMAVAKGAGGWMFNSQSMIADAWHSLTDLASDILTLTTVSWSLRPPSTGFPNGFGKVESLGSLGVSGMLLLGGCFMCLNSCEILYAHVFLDAQAAAEAAIHAHGHSHTHAHNIGPSLHAAWLAGGTVLVKEWLYQKTMKIAKERKSSVLASNAVHHRVDSLTGIVTLFAILGANFLHNATWLDPIGGFLISLLVIRAGLGNTISALYELGDKSIDEDIKASVSKAVEVGLTKVYGGSDVELWETEGVKSGQNYLIDISLRISGSTSLLSMRDIEKGVRDEVGDRVRGVRRVRIRFVTEDEDVSMASEEFIGGELNSRASPEPDDHGHDHVHQHEHDFDGTNSRKTK